MLGLLGRTTRCGSSEWLAVDPPISGTVALQLKIIKKTWRWVRHTYIQYICFFKFQCFRQIMLSRFGVDPMDDHCGPRWGFSFRRGERVTWWVSRGPSRFWIFLDIFCVLLCRLVTGWLWREGHGSVFEGIVWILDLISLAKLKAFLELSEDAEVALHWGSAPVAGSEWQPIGRAWCVFIWSRSRITSCSYWPFSTSWHAQDPLGHRMFRKQKTKESHQLQRASFV